MLTPDDKMWIKNLVGLAMEVIVEALDKNGEVAAQRFRGEYQRRQEAMLRDQDPT